MRYDGGRRKWPPSVQSGAAHTEADDHRNQDDLAGLKAPRRSLMNYNNSVGRGIWCDYCRDEDVPALSRMKLVIFGLGVGMI